MTIKDSKNIKIT